MILLRRKRLVESAEALERAISLAGGDRDALLLAHCWRAMAHEYGGRPDLADRSCQRARRLGPGSAAPAAYTGMIHAIRDQDEQALEWLELALSLDAGCGPALWFRAQIRKARGDYAGARADFLRAIETMQHGRYVVRKGLIQAARDAGDWATAEDQWSELLAEQPRHHLAHLRRAEARQRQGELRGALQDFRRFVQAGDRSDPRLAKLVAGAQQAIVRIERELQ